MTLWLRVRRVWELLASCVVMVLAVSLLSGEGFALPAMFGSLNIVEWTTFVPLAWALSIADVFSSKTQAVEARITRRLAALDLGLFLGASLAGCVAFAGVQALSGADPTSAVAQILIMTGLACTLTLRLGPAAAMLGCSGLVVVTAPYGPTGFAAQYVRVMQNDGNASWALAVGVALCAASCVGIITRRTRVTLSGAQSMAG